jgi:hypothetical protein
MWVVTTPIDELAERFGVPHLGDDEHARMALDRLVLPHPGAIGSNGGWRNAWDGC